MNAIALKLVKINTTFFFSPVLCEYKYSPVCNIPFYLIKDNFVCLSFTVPISLHNNNNISSNQQNIKHTNN